MKEELHFAMIGFLIVVGSRIVGNAARSWFKLSL